MNYIKLHDHIQRHPQWFSQYTNFWPCTDLDLITEFDFLPNTRGFHRAFATDAACQQRTLTFPDTLSCPTLGLTSVLILRPISPDLSCFRTFEFRVHYPFWLNLVLTFLGHHFLFFFFELLCLAEDHWRGLGTRNAHMVNIVLLS